MTGNYICGLGVFAVTGLFAFQSVADTKMAAPETQLELAARIETLWSTNPERIAEIRKPPVGIGWSLYRPLSDQWRTVTVAACEVKVESFGFADAGEIKIGSLTFDLTRSLLPDPLTPDPDYYVYLEGVEPRSASAAFGVQFIQPYQPDFVWLWPGNERVTPLSGATFTILDLKNEDRARDLLSTLHNYRLRYCVMTD